MISKIETDCAVIINKNNNNMELVFYDSANNKMHQSQEYVVATSFLNGCMAIHIESENHIFLLHVSPSQAQNKPCSVIEPYAHLHKFAQNTHIIVNVFGHIENFDKSIFYNAMEHLKIKTIHPPILNKPPVRENRAVQDHVYQVTFDNKNRKLNIASVRDHNLEINYSLSSYLQHTPTRRSPFSLFKNLNLFHTNPKNNENDFNCKLN